MNQDTDTLLRDALGEMPEAMPAPRFSATVLGAVGRRRRMLERARIGLAALGLIAMAILAAPVVAQAASGLDTDLLKFAGAAALALAGLIHLLMRRQPTGEG